MRTAPGPGGPGADARRTSISSAHALEHQRHALPAAHAHGDQPGLLVVELQRVDHRVLQPRARHAEGVTCGYRTAVDVEPVEVDAEVLVGRHDLGREGLVDLDQVDVVD